MKLLKKLGLSAINVAVIAAIAWWAWHTYADYMRNPWTRDGQLRAQVIQVAPRVTGMVTNIPIVDNQFVNAGDLLFELDSEPFEIAIAQAEADLKRARISSRASQIEFDRLKEISARDPGAVSQKDLNRREANYLQSLSQIDVAEESLRGAKLNLQYTRVHAAVDGYVSNVDFQVGTQAVANTPLVALVDSNSFWVFGYFRESQVGKFRIGDPARRSVLALARDAGNDEVLALVDRDGRGAD